MRLNRACSFLLFPVALLSFSPMTTKAEVIESAVEHVYEPEAPDDFTYILLSANGRVLRLRPEEVDWHREVSLITDKSQPLRIDFEDLGDHDKIRSVSVLAEPHRPYDPIDSASAGKGGNDAQPSLDDLHNRSDDVGASLETPQWIYGYFRGKKLRSQSQCFHRAYVWAYDAWVEHQLPTTKIFLFFTKKYIRAYNYRWWFHVSPSIVQSGVESVLDATFTGGPRTVQAWTNVFMRNDAVCPTIPLYYGHANHHQDQWCYLRKTSMYYYHPNTVQKADRGGYQETAFEGRGLYYAERSARPR